MRFESADAMLRRFAGARFSRVSPPSGLAPASAAQPSTLAVPAGGAATAAKARLANYLENLAEAAGHADRATPLKAYCTSLLVPGWRKSVRAIAARLAPENLRRIHQSLHHFVADAPWSEEALLSRVRDYVLPILQDNGGLVAWVVGETAFPKKGTESVGVARQFCAEVGREENCRVAVSLAVTTWTSVLPIAWRLYLPEVWAFDRRRRQRAGVPEEIQHQTKPRIALEQIRDAVRQHVPRGVVLAGAAFGGDSQFRAAVTALGLPYVVVVWSSSLVWGAGKMAGPSLKGWNGGRGRQPVSVRQLALDLPSSAWRDVAWRESNRQILHSRLAALRVYPVYGECWASERPRAEWLLIEWPRGAPEPADYWFASLPVESRFEDLVTLARHHRMVERGNRELKAQLGHYEGRGWRGFHHHAALCIAAYGFLLAERARLAPPARAPELHAPLPGDTERFSPLNAASSVMGGRRPEWSTIPSEPMVPACR